MKTCYRQNKEKKYSLRGGHISIIPTYKTNFTRHLARFSHRLKDFPEDLKWLDFEYAVSRLKTADRLKTIRFAGGEATLWKFLEKALEYCHSQRIFTILTTNALLPINIHPSRTTINLCAYFSDEKIQEQIRRNIDTCYGERQPHFVYHFSEEDTEDRIIRTIELAKKYKGTAFFAPRLQVERFSEKKISIEAAQKIKTLWDFATYNIKKELGQDMEFDFPASTTVFSKSEFLQKINEKTIPTPGCDYCFYGRFVLNPDGKTMYPCPFLEISSDISQYYGRGDMWEKEFLPQIEEGKLEHKICPAGMY